MVNYSVSQIDTHAMEFVTLVCSNVATGASQISTKFLDTEIAVKNVFQNGSHVMVSASMGTILVVIDAGNNANRRLNIKLS